MKALAKLRRSGKQTILTTSRKTVRPVTSSGNRFQIRGHSTSFSAKTRRLPTFFSKRYKLLAPVGRGGVGLVYKAHDSMLKIDVAIKFLPERLARDHNAADRFKHEAGIAMQLSHEHIVKLHNLEVDRNKMFLVMEYVNGLDFRQIIQQQGQLPIHVVQQVVGSCAIALDYAHERHVLHKDMKPENLMLNEQSILKIVDFGTARRMGAPARGDEDYLEGSPPYMSPEQIADFELDGRTDVYSLGAIAYELLCGSPPFPFNSDIETILEDDPPPLEDLPEPIIRVVTKAMAKDRDDRWSTATEFANEYDDAIDECEALEQP